MGLFTRDKTEKSTAPITKEHRARWELFDRYWKYYKGHHKRHLKTTANNADDNVTINHSRRIVNQGVDFLFGKEVFFEIDANRQERTPEEAYLDTVWADDPMNNFSKVDFLQGVAMYGGVVGTPFVRLYPAGDMREDLPTLVDIDPALVDIKTEDDNKNHVIEYCIVWQSGKDWKRHRFTRTDGGLWEIVEETHKRGRWEMVGEPLPWDYTFAPIFHCQNLKYPKDVWGISDLEDADLNDSVNFVASNTNRIVRFHAHPKTIALNVESSLLQKTSIDGLTAVPVPDANVYNLEMQSDLSSSRNHQRDLTQSLYDIADVPLLDTVNTQVGALSGFALRILYGPLISKTTGKQNRYGGMLSRINHAILELNDMSIDVIVNNRWQDPLPQHAKEQAELFNTFAGTPGVSIFAAAKMAGYTEDEAQLLTQRMRTSLRDQVDPGPAVTGGDAPDSLESTKGLAGIQLREAKATLAEVSAGTTHPENAVDLLNSLGIDKEKAQRMVERQRNFSPVSANEE